MAASSATFVPLKTGFADGNPASGYTWTSGAAFNWVELKGSSTALTPVSDCDDCVQRDVSIGFSFTFYGQPYSTVHIGANGSVMFGQATTQWGPIGLPTETLNAPAILPFWSDWDPAGSGDVYAGPVAGWGAGGHAAFAIQWQGVENWDCDRGGTASWEVILIDDGRIVFQYKDADLSDAYCNQGKDMTVGLQRDSLDPPGCFAQYSNEQSIISSNTAIEWQPHPGECGVAVAASPTTVGESPTPEASATPGGLETPTPDPGIETPAPGATAAAAAEATNAPERSAAGGTTQPRSPEGTLNPRPDGADAEREVVEIERQKLERGETSAIDFFSALPGDKDAGPKHDLAVLLEELHRQGRLSAAPEGTARPSSTRTPPSGQALGTGKEKPSRPADDSGGGGGMLWLAAAAGAVALVAAGAGGYWWWRERRPLGRATG
ncbi:MAG: hypothetical protein HY873_07180 [Chloroflexi bacterium]|nr:hypothetical protein [Chloroflexota bacterium]